MGAIAGAAWSNLINIGLFQAGWFICVLGAAHGFPWAAAAVGLLPVLIHLGLVRDRWRQGSLLAFALLLGMVVDGFHLHTGVLIFTGGSLHGALPPAWILMLWIQFAMTLHGSLAWLIGRPVLGAILGGVGGALAYWAGVRLGAAAFGADLSRCLLQIGLTWVLATPILLIAARMTRSTADQSLYRGLGVRRGP